MTTNRYEDTLGEFERIARNKVKDSTMLALIVDSPWLPGYAGIDTMDFYFDPQIWLDTYEKVHADLPGVAFIPDAWVEFGMANEPSGWGVVFQWSSVSTPLIRHYPGGLEAIADVATPDPERDGLMPVVLRQYERMQPVLKAKGFPPRMAGARGPLAVASHLIGVTEFLMATQLDSDRCLRLLDHTTDLCIRWLKSQLARMDEPLGVLVLDDVVGMMSPEDARVFGIPFLRRIFEAFPGLVCIFHNDTPNDRIFEDLSTIGMDVFNFSHEIDAERARALLGPDVVLMGNIPPLDGLVRGTVDQVREAAEQMMEKVARCAPVLISPGGGVSPETPIENLQVLLDVVGAG